MFHDSLYISVFIESFTPVILIEFLKHTNYSLVLEVAV